MGERAIWVTGKRDKWIEMLGREDRRAVVRGSRAVLEEGTRIPRRIFRGGGMVVVMVGGGDDDVEGKEGR